MSFVAIEFEDDRIWIAAAKKARETKVHHAFSIDTADASSDDDVAERLRAELSKRGLSRSDAIIVVSRSSAEMRELEVPPAPDAELPGMVKLLARNEFATLNDNWLLDFVPLGDDPTAARTILAAGISPELKQQVGKTIEASGLRAQHAVLRPFESISLVESRLQDGKCRMIVNPNGDEVDVVIVVGIVPIATRTVRIPANCELEKRARLLCGEIKRTMASSHGSIGDRRLEEVLIFCDPPKHQSLGEEISRSLDLEVELIDPFQQVAVSSGLDRPETPARYAALIGSLVREFSDSRHHLDFLNPRKPPAKKSNLSRVYLYGGIAAATVLLAVGFAWWTLRSQAQEIARLNTELQEAIRQNEGDGGKFPSVEQVVSEVGKIDKWKLSDVNWLEELYQYSDRFLTPDDAIVDAFDAALRRDEPRIIVRSRVAGVQKESGLLERLDSRPYQVVPTKSGVSDEDESYPMSLDFNVLLTEDRRHIIEEIDEKAAVFLRNRHLDSSDSTEPDSPQ
jgi:hypothetical protein